MPIRQPPDWLDFARRRENGGARTKNSKERKSASAGQVNPQRDGGRTPANETSLTRTSFPAKTAVAGTAGQRPVAHVECGSRDLHGLERRDRQEVRLRTIAAALTGTLD
jgi:hypothetical protein